MKKATLGTPLLLLILVLLGLWIREKKNQSPVRLTEVTTGETSLGNKPSATSSVSERTTSNGPQGSTSSTQLNTPPGDSLSAEEKLSLRQMTNLLAKAVNGAKESEVLKALTDLGMTPETHPDENPATGAMDLVRTKESIPGTRYFHAQYFGDTTKDMTLQHMSFELRPAPDSKDQAIQAIKSAFQVGDPVAKDGNFYEWKLGNGYCAWASPLQEKDLEAHPYNTYTRADLGTIRVAVEACEEEHEN